MRRIALMLMICGIVAGLTAPAMARWVWKGDRWVYIDDSQPPLPPPPEVKKEPTPPTHKVEPPPTPPPPTPPTPKIEPPPPPPEVKKEPTPPPPKVEPPPTPPTPKTEPPLPPPPEVKKEPTPPAPKIEPPPTPPTTPTTPKAEPPPPPPEVKKEPTPPPPKIEPPPTPPTPTPPTPKTEPPPKAEPPLPPPTPKIEPPPLPPEVKKEATPPPPKVEPPPTPPPPKIEPPPLPPEVKKEPTPPAPKIEPPPTPPPPKIEPPLPPPPEVKKEPTPPAPKIEPPAPKTETPATAPAPTKPPEFTDPPAAGPATAARKNWWQNLVKPTDETMLFEQGRAQLKAGNFRAAAADFKSLIKGFPSSSRREEAMWLRGAALMGMVDYYAAFEQYEELVTNYAGSPHYRDALVKQIEIAEKFLGGARQKLLGIPMMPAEGTAIEILRKVYEHQPAGDLADAVVLRIADHYWSKRQWQDAEDYYDRYCREFPNRDAVRHAELRRARCAIERCRGSRYDTTCLQLAYDRLKAFQQKFPEDAGRENVGPLLEQVRDMQAMGLYQTVVHYQRTGKPLAAAYYAERLQERFPDSPWSAKARKLVADMSMKKQEPTP